jgi:hypothetical protein
MSSIMKSELERLARVAVSHGWDDPAVDVFLVFIGALDPLPDAATLEPAARQIGKLRLAQALDRPGEPRLGACRLLAAACAERPRPGGGSAPFRRSVPAVGRPDGGLTRTVTVERPLETGRRLPELFETLLHAIRVALSHSPRLRS